MPYDRSRYPAEWDSIAMAIKVAADWTCQDCGLECRRPGEAFDTHKRTMSVHHLDHMPEHCDAPNLIALCAKCHLIRDAPHHAQNAARTRRMKRIASGQLPMELEV